MTLIYTMLITVALYYAGSRAQLTRFVWSRYPIWLSRLMDCSMCSGAWYGLFVAVVATQGFEYQYPGLEDHHAPFVCFLGSAIWTPLIAAKVQHGIEFLGVKEEITSSPPEEMPLP